MQQIGEWLDKLGMSEYAELFAENKINISALRYLTDQDLKDIGIPLGHRRIMQAAISQLAGAAGPAASEASEGIEQKPQDTAERRQVTVSGRFDSALGPHGPGGPARGDFGLPEVRSPRLCSASAGS
jgi:hypothetical protein